VPGVITAPVGGGDADEEDLPLLSAAAAPAAAAPPINATIRIFLEELPAWTDSAFVCVTIAVAAAP
jgi:hypothetical protein